MINLINWLNGFLCIRVFGIAGERFINLCGYRNILLWNICRKENCYEMYISIKAFKELRQIVRKTKVKVVIQQRKGLPFFLSKMNNRKVFIVCCMLTIFMWQMSGNFIWKIEVNGNYRITSEQIKDYLEKQNIHVGMQKKNLNIEQLEKDFRLTFHEVTWTSGKVEGTTFKLDIKEAEGVKEFDNNSEGEQYDYVSPIDGIIHSIVVRKGVPKVKPGDVVSKDMLLVEGIIPIMNDDGTLRENKYVRSDADIFIEYKTVFEESLPLTYIKKVYTGRTKQIPYFRLGNHEITVKKRPDYLINDIIIRESTPKFLKEVRIPLSWGDLTYREYQNVESLYTENEAKAILNEKNLKFLEGLSEKGVQIIEKDVKIVKEEDGWLLRGEFLIAEPVDRLQRVTSEVTDVVVEKK